MWLQQRFKGLPGLLSSSWARRLLVGLLLFLIFYWYLGAERRWSFSGSAMPGGPTGKCLQAEIHRWSSVVERGEGVYSSPQEPRDTPFVSGNGHLLLDVDSNRLWVASSSRPGSAPVHQTEYSPRLGLHLEGPRAEAKAAMLWFRKGSVLLVRCVAPASPPSARDCLFVREEFLAHRSRANVYLQRVHISNPYERALSFELSSENRASAHRFSSSAELWGTKRSCCPPARGGNEEDHRLPHAVQPHRQHHPLLHPVLLRGASAGAAAERRGPRPPGGQPELRRPLLQRPRHHARREPVARARHSTAQILQLFTLWTLTLQKRGCKALVAAGAHGRLQAVVLSFGGLQFTENHLQFQADPDVLHNSYALRGIRYNRDLISLAVLLDQDGKPFLHLWVKPQEQPVKLYACEAGCLNEPVELTSEVKGHTFPVMVTQPITPLLYISTDLQHLQDLRHTLHLKAILAHEEHMANRYPGLPFLFWFSVASLITLFHLFLFKLIYNEYCGPGAKPFFRSKV
ncbi:unnamed protein product, partial [Tetraodon nigroviridis]